MADDDGDGVKKEGRSMILSDKTQQDLSLNGIPIVTPYCEVLQRRVHSSPHRTYPALSYGQSSAGYDIRLAEEEFYLIRPKATVNVKDFQRSDLTLQCSDEDEHGVFYVMPAYSYALGLSLEAMDIPDDVLGICYTKSTYARAGVMITTTPLEPGWTGRLVIEIANFISAPVRIYANEGICQLVLHALDTPCAVSYADREGKYQNQQSVVEARV